MRTITTTLYHFDELPTDIARENARSWWRDCTDGDEYTHTHEATESFTAFAEHFGARVGNNWWFSSQIETTKLDIIHLDEDNFVGIDTYITDRDYMPTGYYLDCDLWTTFYDKLREHGSPVRAFHDAISAALEAVVEDAAYQETDEYIDEMLTINDYEFTEDGKHY